MNRKYIRRLTPKGAWDYFAPYGVERFISESIDDDRYDIVTTDYRTMCQLFVRDFPSIYERPFVQEDLDYITKLLEQYMREYVEENGGVENLKLLTREELDMLWDEETTEFFRVLERYGRRMR